jgi:hypothetical protein
MVARGLLEEPPKTHDSPPTQLGHFRRAAHAPQHGPHDRRPIGHEFFAHVVCRAHDGHGNQHDWQRVLLGAP